MVMSSSASDARIGKIEERCMASINGYADIVVDWRSVLNAYAEHAELMAAAAEDRELLRRLLANAERLKSLQG
jgi:hypothetical protein